MMIVFNGEGVREFLSVLCSLRIGSWDLFVWRLD